MSLIAITLTRPRLLLLLLVLMLHDVALTFTHLSDFSLFSVSENEN